MVDIIYTGLSALRAHQQAIEVTSHNIANATTEGYTRQRADLTSEIPELTPVGMMGRGVTVEAIRRLADNLITERLRQSTTETARLTALNQSLSTSEATFNEPSDNGLSSMIDKLFASFQDLSSNPESTALRSTALANIGAFTDTLNGMADSLSSQSSNIATTITDDISEANELMSSISSIDQQVRELSLRGSPPNDLLDQRERLISKLSEKLDISVHYQADGGVRIDSHGIMLVGTNYAEKLSVGENNDGSLAILLGNGTGVDISGGRLGALMQMHNTTIPGLGDGLDTLAVTVAKALNQIQATGTSETGGASSYLSEYAIGGTQTGVNLDSGSLIAATAGGLGLSKAFTPSFTDSNGNTVARNLTINVYNQTTGTAQKYILRYDPATAAGSRSLNDLVSAINSGRATQSGGFTLYPSDTGGIANLTAKIVSVDGGAKLELTAANGYTVDFSSALDVQPTSTAWTGPAVTITGSDPNLAGKRIAVEVTGANLQAWTIDGLTGSRSLYAQIPTASLNNIAQPFGGGGLSITAGGGTFQNGESFSVDLDTSGTVGAGTGTMTQTTEWTSGDANVTVSGRYTGGMTYAPGRDWSMRVITSGTIGSNTAAPLVEFSYYTGPSDAPVLNTKQVTLDSTHPAGSPIEIAEGVYASFESGSLSTAGNQVSWIVDAEPDQANLLSTMGINGMFKGDSASTLSVATELGKDPARFAIGNTRTVGDNSNLLEMAAVRSSKLFNSSTTNTDDFYQGMVSDLGVRVAQSARLLDNQQALGTNLSNQRQQVSGVSIDEEVSFLILQQQAYTAAARLITTARENVQTLLGILQ
jgi:flagellar hook-associated protein 1 FlgK